MPMFYSTKEEDSSDKQKKIISKLEKLLQKPKNKNKNH